MVGKSAAIVLVEDNPDHEALTLRCLGRMNVSTRSSSPETVLRP